MKLRKKEKTVDLSDLLKFMVRTQIIIFQRFHFNFGWLFVVVPSLLKHVKTVDILSR